MLFVDPSQPRRSIHAAFCRHNDLAVVEAASYDAALATIGSARPDVVVAQEEAGCALLEAAEREPALANLPVIALVDRPLAPRAARFCAVRPGNVSSPELLLTLLIVLDCHVLHAPLRELAGWACSRELAEA